MKHPMKLLPLMIGSLLASSAVYAQNTCEELEGTPPGLYTTTDEGRTILIRDDEVIELGPGDAGFADESGVTRFGGAEMGLPLPV